MENFYSLKIINLKLTFETRIRSRFFCNFYTFAVRYGVCLPSNKGNELKLKRNQKSNREKSNLCEQILRVFLKENHQDLY